MGSILLGNGTEVETISRSILPACQLARRVSCSNVAPLAHNSCLLHFKLQHTLSPSTSPVSTVSAFLPLRHYGAETRGKERAGSGTSEQQDYEVHIQDLRDGDTRAVVEVVRILDPEPREPYISLSRIFFACRLSPIEGLLRFGLSRPDYDTSLAGIAPFVDVWVPLKTAREIAIQLQVFDELSGLLDWDSRKAFSVEDKEEGGLVHNWKIASSHVDPAKYSTAAMILTGFPRIHLLPASTQVRTLLPADLGEKPSRAFPSNFEQLYAHMVSWSIQVYEEYLEENEIATTNSWEEDEGNRKIELSSNSLLERRTNSPDLTASLFFTTLLSLLKLSHELSNANKLPIGNSYSITNELKIEREEISRGNEENSTRTRLGLVDALTRLVAKEWRHELERESEAGLFERSESEPTSNSKSNRAVEGGKNLIEVESRLRAVEISLKSLGEESPERREGTPDSESVLRNDLDLLHARLDEMEKRFSNYADFNQTFPRSIPTYNAISSDWLRILLPFVLAFVCVLPALRNG